MRNKIFKNEEIFRLIVKERVLSIAIFLIITIIAVWVSIYTVNKSLREVLENEVGNTNNKINREALYRGIINLEKEEVVENQREATSGVKDGFDKYEASNSGSQSQSSDVSSNSSIGGSTSVGGNTNNNVAVIDNSSIIGINARILEGEDFNPKKHLNLRATDINGKDISDKITIVENNVDVYSPGKYIVKAIAPLSNGNQKEVILTVNVEPVALDLMINSFEATSEVVNKGENIVLNLDLHSNKDYISALSVNISGIDYPLKKVEVRNKYQKYTLELPSINEASVIEYKLNSIRMSDNTVVEINKKFNITVAKDKPVISKFDYEEVANKDTSEILIKLEIDDKENSILNEKVYAYVYDKSNKLIELKQIFLDGENYVRFTAVENGIYNIKVIADLDLTGKVLKDEEIFASSLEVKCVDKSNFSGEDIQLKLGEKFNVIEDLKIKAIDVDGKDITDKVVVEENNVDVNNPGKYSVKLLVINKNNEEIRKEFMVEVIEPKLNRILGRKITDNKNNENELINFKDDNTRYSNTYYAYNKNDNITVSGDSSETFESDLIINGEVLKGNGGAPSGKIEVELPTRTIFSVNKDGKFIGSNFNIHNKGGADIELSVAQFIEENIHGGITIDNSIKNFGDVGRATISLQLNAVADGIEKNIYLDKNISDEKLVTVRAGSSASIHILGKAGTGKSNEEDTNGATETFTLRFRIKKA